MPRSCQFLNTILSCYPIVANYTLRMVIKVAIVPEYKHGYSEIFNSKLTICFEVLPNSCDCTE